MLTKYRRPRKSFNNPFANLYSLPIILLTKTVFCQAPALCQVSSRSWGFCPSFHGAYDFNGERGERQVSKLVVCHVVKCAMKNYTAGHGVGGVQAYSGLLFETDGQGRPL